MYSSCFYSGEKHGADALSSLIQQVNELHVHVAIFLQRQRRPPFTCLAASWVHSFVRLLNLKFLFLPFSFLPFGAWIYIQASLSLSLKRAATIMMPTRAWPGPRDQVYLLRRQYLLQLLQRASHDILVNRLPSFLPISLACFFSHLFLFVCSLFSLLYSDMSLKVSLADLLVSH